ncbi:MAG TPA: PAS domain S-box protein, partial [Candidatus Limnocylindrales bacterium]
EIDELIGRSVETLVPDGARGVHPGHRAKYLRDPRIRRMGFGRELIGRRKDGTAVPVEIGLSSFLSGGERLVSVVVADISARKQIEEKLQAANETLGAIVESSPVATILFDRQHAVRLWNPAAERIFGWSADEMVGQPIDLITPEPEREEARAFRARILAGETVSGVELRRLHRTDGVIEVVLYGAPQRDAHGRVVGVVELLADISAQRRLEEQLLQAQKMESIGRLAGGVAHDFNNILTAITGFSELLLMDLPQGSPARDSVEAIRQASERASGLTQQLLAFSRRQVLQPRVLDLNEAIRAIEPMLRRLIGEHISLAINLRRRIGHIQADPSQLEQVVLNLVVNARDAMPDGGRLSIETGTADFDEGYAAEHFELNPGRYVMLAVSDTGVGMDRATRAHMFEPFFTTKERGQGTGLGLATIYGIVRQSGGHIWLYSEPGRGTTFKLYFPFVASGVVEEAAPSPPAVGGDETILLVEDEDTVRDIASVVLERGGYRVLAAIDGREAIAVEQSFRGQIDLLVTDVVMPGMSGPDLARRIKARRPGLRALFLSGYTEDMIGGQEDLDVGDAFLGKPFTPDSLARKVRDVLAARVTAAR